MSIMNDVEKTPMQSKKFLSYLISNFFSKAIIFYMVFKSSSPALITWAITASTFIDVGYILGQTALDIFVRMTLIKSKKSESDS